MLMPNPRTKRFDSMSDQEILAEHEKYMDNLDAMTNGRGDEAYMKANSARMAWKALEARGKSSLVLEAGQQRRVRNATRGLS